MGENGLAKGNSVMNKVFIRKLFAIIVALMMLVSLPVTALMAGEADNPAADQVAAQTLNAIGLFRGVGDDADGNPIYNLESDSTRLQGLIMLVRLMGAEDEALSGKYSSPFEDVPDWAQGYVAYAWQMGWTNGTSPTTFNPNSPITATQYLTFVLSALGYERGDDFQWDAAWELTDELGITNGEFNAENNTLLRGEMVIVSLVALNAPIKDTEQTLLEILVEDGVFDKLAEDGIITDEAMIEALKSGDPDLVKDVIGSAVSGALDAIQSLDDQEPSTGQTAQSGTAGGGGGSGSGSQQQNPDPVMYLAESGGTWFGSPNGYGYSVCRVFMPGETTAKSINVVGSDSGFYTYTIMTQGDFELYFVSEHNPPSGATMVSVASTVTDMSLQNTVQLNGTLDLIYSNATLIDARSAPALNYYPAINGGWPELRALLQQGASIKLSVMYNGATNAISAAYIQEVYPAQPGPVPIMYIAANDGDAFISTGGSYYESSKVFMPGEMTATSIYVKSSPRGFYTYIKTTEEGVEVYDVYAHNPPSGETMVSVASTVTDITVSNIIQLNGTLDLDCSNATLIDARSDVLRNTYPAISGWPELRAIFEQGTSNIKLSVMYNGATAAASAAYVYEVTQKPTGPDPIMYISGMNEGVQINIGGTTYPSYFAWFPGANTSTSIYVNDSAAPGFYTYSLAVVEGFNIFNISAHNPPSGETMVCVEATATDVPQPDTVQLNGTLELSCSNTTVIDTRSGPALVPYPSIATWAELQALIQTGIWDIKLSVMYNGATNAASVIYISELSMKQIGPDPIMYISGMIAGGQVNIGGTTYSSYIAWLPGANTSTSIYVNGSAAPGFYTYSMAVVEGIDIYNVSTHNPLSGENMVCVEATVTAVLPQDIIQLNGTLDLNCSNATVIDTRSGTALAPYPSIATWSELKALIQSGGYTITVSVIYNANNMTAASVYIQTLTQP